MTYPIYLLRNNQTTLISETGGGYVNLCESLASLYKINNRTYEEIIKILSRFPGYPQVQAASDEVMYSGAELIDRSSRKDLVHVTVIKNWIGAEGKTIMGNTCGHLHGKASTEFVEIYQLFDGFLGLAIHKREENVVELHLRRGELLPIRVPSDAIMTLFNLGAQPVVTLDWATAEHNSSKTLQETIGPVMAMIYNPAGTTSG